LAVGLVRGYEQRVNSTRDEAIFVSQLAVLNLDLERLRRITARTDRGSDEFEQ
jgi:hypothetical protein